MTDTSRLEQPDDRIKPDPRRGAPAAVDPARADAAFAGADFMELPLGSRIHATARQALSSMHEASGELAEAMVAVQGDGVIGGDGKRSGDWRLTPGGKLRAFSGDEPALADAAESRFKSIAEKVDKSLADLGEVEELLTGSISKKLRDARSETPSGVALAGEIRRHLLGMEPGKRTQFLAKRIAEGDLQTVSAVLDVPGYLAGLDDQAREVVHGLAAKQFAAGESAALDGARRASEMIRSGGTVFVERWRASTSQLGPGKRDRAAKIEKVRGGGAA
ncbi:MAG: hypothetical protein AAGB48_10620 [Planctomycetota bacterium]